MVDHVFTPPVPPGLPWNLPAARLKKKFGVYGHFYTFHHEGVDFPCRSLLELIAHARVPKSVNAIQKLPPDLLVVMMNPGSSRPLDGAYGPLTVRVAEEIDRARELVPTRPDNTQYQVMRLLLAWGLGHARVLNLSDLRQPKSPVVARMIQTLARQPGGTFHSLFSPARRRELDGLAAVPAETPVLAGWGRHEPFRPLAEQCLGWLGGRRILGVPVAAGSPFYAHPSPMLQRLKDRWLAEVAGQWPGAGG